MKQKHLIALLQTDYTTVHVVFTDSTNYREYTYKAPLNMQLEEGDSVVVNPPSGLKIAEVKKVDQYAKIDVDADYDYHWIVQKVDTTEYDKLNATEEKCKEMLLEIERQSQRAKMVAQLESELPMGSPARKLFDELKTTVSGGLISEEV